MEIQQHDGVVVEAAGISAGLGRWKRWEERNPIISFPTNCYPPFLGILILSLRDMILFLLRGDLGAP